MFSDCMEGVLEKVDTLLAHQSIRSAVWVTRNINIDSVLDSTRAICRNCNLPGNLINCIPDYFIQNKISIFGDFILFKRFKLLPDVVKRERQLKTQTISICSIYGIIKPCVDYTCVNDVRLHSQMPDTLQINHRPHHHHHLKESKLSSH